MDFRGWIVRLSPKDLGHFGFHEDQVGSWGTWINIIINQPKLCMPQNPNQEEHKVKSLSSNRRVAVNESNGGNLHSYHV